MFKPNPFNENEELNKMSSGKQNNFPSTNKYGSQTNYSNSNSNVNNKFSYTSTKPNVESRINMKQINPVFSQPPIKNNRRPQNFEEVEDDRPAFVEGSKREPEIPMEGETGDLHECNGCGRKFREEALQKHAKACKKVFQSKRKAFDTKKKRIIDSEHAMILRQAEIEEKSNPKLKQVKAKKKNNWKKQSDMLRNVAAANKTGADFTKKGSGNVVQITGKNNGYSNNNDDDDGLTFCGLCSRKYNDEAYKRHLTHCEKKDRDAKMKGKSNVIGKQPSKPVYSSKMKK